MALWAVQTASHLSVASASVEIPPLWSLVPFLTLLLGIALVPLLWPRGWAADKNKAIFAALCSVPALAFVLGFSEHGYSQLAHAAEEYLSFIILLGTLFTISGGIAITGDLQATPKINTTFLAIGTLLASVIGTTGAAMILVRPLLRTNHERKHKRHIFIFLIFTVANSGGLLTPLGDPPLFLGFLKGVPFSWTLGLWGPWVLVNGFLLAIFYVLDRYWHSKEKKSDLRRDAGHVVPLRVNGWRHVFLLGGVIAVILLFSGELRLLREPLMLLLAAASYFPDILKAAKHPHGLERSARRLNRFSFHPMTEVTILFAGIFITMIPALGLLKAHAPELGLSKAWHFFWLTGGLSSFLDNAPTYLTFFSLGQGLNACSAASCVAGVPETLLAAISCGAVFMGALTYIGNAPNFMIKAIVEESGVKMPSFHAYTGIAAIILLPIMLICALLFFS